MPETEPSHGSTPKRIRQSISVPFCWEEKPGTPFKNWKPTTPQTKPIAIPPAKLIASIPFQWEEKPGTPLPCFLEPTLTLPALDSDVFLVSSPMNPPVNGTFWGETNGYDDDDDNETEIHESYSVLSGTETDDSFNSANSLLANSLIPTVTLSTVVPFESLTSGDQEGSPPGSPAASETDSNISSYAIGPTTLAGSSLLEWLFPLLTPRSSILAKGSCSETVVSNIQVTNQSKDLDHHHGKKRTDSTQRPLTLGELIMMSRRQSYHRKAMKMQTQNLSKGGPSWSRLGCCIFRTSNILRKLHMDWKRKLQLKLM